MISSSFKNRIEYLLKHNSLIQIFYQLILNNFFRFIGLFIKTDNNLVLINSYGGRRYNDSSKAISDYLISHTEYNQLHIIWAFECPDKFDIPFEKIKIDTWKYFHTALKAKYWITCVNIERGLRFKKKETRYLNTWHGVPIKLIGNAVHERKIDFSYTDVFCYSGSFDKEIYMNDLGVLEKNMILSGLPRNDGLYHFTEERINEIKQKNNLPLNKKIILYAPTWRNSQDGGKTCNLKPPIDIAFWEKNLAKDYVILFRAHSFTTQLIGIQFNNFIRDMSNYPEINDLMIISDILISDYSAIIFDYSILERPIISFAYDYDDYIINRGFYVNLEKEIGIIKTQEELISKIKFMDYDIECEKTAVFQRKYLEEGGNATEMCVKALFVN